jgi:hypothetical protein
VDREARDESLTGELAGRPVSRKNLKLVQGADAGYLLDKGLAVTCFDADPVNSTLASFSGLQVTKVDLIETTEKGRRINPRPF